VTVVSHPALPEGLVVLERGWLSSNNVVLLGAEDAALVDSGYWTHSEQTVALVSRAVGRRTLRTLVNTHLHSDHCGGNAALQQHFPALRTYVPPGLAGAVRAWDPVALTYGPTGQHCPRFLLDGILQAGTTMQLGALSWEIHAAPGHDAHSIILFEPRSRTLISADALWQNGFGVVFQELEGERAFDEVAATLDLIERLRPAVVVPGHGAVFDNIAAALDRARSRLQSYMAHPERHASHAAKVLLKFKLLEIQSTSVEGLVAWARSTPYFQLVRNRWFPSAGLEAWVATLVDDLVRSGAAARSGPFVLNA
jgi:glyoxylase-like metal-dependent hydrolase (beta-lactamase superfamily II)